MAEGNHTLPRGSVILSLLTMCYCFVFLLESLLLSLKPQGVLTWFLAVTITRPLEEIWQERETVVSWWKLQPWHFCVCLCSRAVSVELTSFSFCWGEGGSIRASWTTVSQTCACGPLAVSLNWTGSSKLAPCPLAKMDPSARTLKKGSLLWKSTASFPMQSSNFTAGEIIKKILI